MEMLMEAEKGREYDIDNIIIMADWNTVVAEGKDGKEVGSSGLGSSNNRREKLVNFYKRIKIEGH